MEMKKAINQFLKEFQDSSAFKDYKYQKERIRKVPGMKDRINEFRKKRFEFQKYEGEDLFEKIDSLYIWNFCFLYIADYFVFFLFYLEFFTCMINLYNLCIANQYYV